MRRASWYLAALLAMVGCAWASDQEKAEKQIRMMTAMSRDDTARSIISRTFADVFKMQRPQMVVERKNLGLNYGGLFLAHELALSWYSDGGDCPAAPRTQKHAEHHERIPPRLEAHCR